MTKPLIEATKTVFKDALELENHTSNHKYTFVNIILGIVYCYSKIPFFLQSVHKRVEDLSNDGLLELIMKQSILSKCLLLSAHFGNRVHLHKRRIFQSEENCGIFSFE